MVKPISPDEILEARAKVIPEQIIQAFNQCIAEKWDGRSAIVKQDNVISKIQALIPDTPRQAIFDNNWLEVDDLYRKAGWKVSYDKPSYGDNDFEAYWRFSK